MKSVAARTRKTSPTDAGPQLGRLYSLLQGMMGSVRQKYSLAWAHGVNCQNDANGDKYALSFLMGFGIEYVVN